MELLAIASDHAGFELKKIIMQHFGSQFQFKDFGTHSTDSCDYPDYVHPLAHAISTGSINRGILICGTANGVAITANKYKGVRAGIAWQVELATLTRQHNDANIICLPARFVEEKTALEIVQSFISTPFEGGRHQNRVNKIDQLIP